MRNAAVAVKIETTPGSDAISGTPAAADWVGADFEVDFDPVVVENPELTGTLDRAPSIVGGLRPILRMRVPLRGSGTASTAPDWGKLMRCCTYSEAVQSSAVGAPTAATAGTTTTVTAQAPFGTTANQYRGMPLFVSGDQSFTTGIIGYTTGRVISFGEARATALTTASLLQIPANVLYAPTSDEAVFKSCTIYFYADGYNWRFGGCQGTWSLELMTGGIGYLTFEMRGQMLAMTNSALPTGWNTTIRPTPPRFVAGRCQLNYAIARSRRLVFDAGVEVIQPDNPEALEGFDPTVPIARNSRGSIDPLMDTNLATTLYDNFRAGTAMPLIAVAGSTAGNRFLVTAPSARATGMRPGARDGLGQHEIAFQLDGADSDLFLCSF
jgi:hypothetical protein